MSFMRNPQTHFNKQPMGCEA